MAFGFGTKEMNERAQQVGGDGPKSEWWKPKVGEKQGESASSNIRIVTLMEEMGSHSNGSGKPFTCIGKSNGCPKCKESDEYVALHKGDKDALKKNPCKVNVKFLCWLLDLSDLDENKKPKFKLAQLGWGIVGAVNDLYENPDWQERFKDGIVAMKLTVVGTKTGALKQNVEYSVQPSPAADPLTPELAAEAAKLDDVKTVALNLKKKQAKEWGIDLKEEAYAGAPDHQEPPTAFSKAPDEEVRVEDIPF